MKRQKVNKTAVIEAKTNELRNYEGADSAIPSLKKVLIVDDSKINRQILRKILCDSYTIIEAENGTECLDILHEQYNNISAIILDISMPVMNGYEVLEKLRVDAILSQIPVIVTTGNDDNDAEVKALSLGAQDFLVKPYKPNIIKHRLANTIFLRETTAFINVVQYDTLTGLYTKEYFYHMVSDILKNNPDTQYDIICCDIEKFKLVNDLYGTHTGDELLKHCARVIGKYQGKSGILSRIGADVFALFWVHRENYDSQCFATLNEQINNFHINLNISIRYGVYVIDDPEVPVNIMCDRACLAVASIKGLYDTHFTYYDRKIRQKLLDERYISANMEQALKDKQFVVYYQPKYELKTEKIVGAEALIRWNNPEKGWMSPGEFIPLFEKNGFITDMDIYVWEETCKNIRSWIDRGIRPIPLSVNVSRTDMYNPYIDKVIMSLIDKYDLKPKNLNLEITESAYTENSKQLINTVKKLKELGFIIEMDDFGSGYSSLNMLSDLPIDILKLDIGFMQNQRKKNSRSILSFIINLARWLNLGVIAEGAENLEQINLLNALDCECAQGYYFAKPMPIDELEKLLVKQNEELKATSLETSDIDPLEVRIYHPHTILVLDETAKEYHKLQDIFSDKYNVHNMKVSDGVIHYIKENKAEISAVVFVLDNANTIEELTQIIEVGRIFNIPVITIHSSKNYMEAAIEAGAVACIERPYVEKVMKTQVESVICLSQVHGFKTERGLNYAIYDMKRRAEQDSLTGLLNRGEFEYRVQDFFRNNYGEIGVFIMLDIDNFKIINDNFGHTAGDEVLQKMGSYLLYLFPETKMIGRMGGDEFAILIPTKINKEELAYKANKLCYELRLNTDMASVSCSVGISMFPDHGYDFRTLYECADMALLQSKRTGKCRYKFYETE